MKNGEMLVKGYKLVVIKGISSENLMNSMVTIANSTVHDLPEVHTAILDMDNQQKPTGEHMELCSLLCASLDGKGVGERMGTCICMLSPFTIHLKLSKHC